MEHLVYYDIAAAFVLLTALVAYHLRKYSDNFQSRVYRVMLYALLVVSTSDFLLFWKEITFGKTGTTVLLYICILGQEEWNALSGRKRDGCLYRPGL